MDERMVKKVYNECKSNHNQKNWAWEVKASLLNGYSKTSYHSGDVVILILAFTSMAVAYFTPV